MPNFQTRMINRRFLNRGGVVTPGGGTELPGAGSVGFTETGGGYIAPAPQPTPVPYTPDMGTVLGTPPGRQPAPYDLGAAQRARLAQAKAGVRTARTARQGAKKEARQAKRALVQARRGPAPLGTTKAANKAAAKTELRQARKARRATKGTVAAAKKTKRQAARAVKKTSRAMGRVGKSGGRKVYF